METPADANIGRLLKIAGARASPRPESMQRARELAHRSWLRMLEEQSARRRARWLRATWAAGAVSVAVLGVLLLQMRGAFVAAPLDARVQRVEGGVELQYQDGSRVQLAVDQRLAPGMLTTGKGRVAIDIDAAVSVRLDRETRLELIDGQRWRLLSGAIYLDSGSMQARTASFVISTPAAEVRHVGTQFKVAIEGGSTRVSVREGHVEVARGTAAAARIGAGEELLLTAGGGITRRRAATFGADWEWTASIAPRFDIEGRSTVEFVSWIAREHGWMLHFDSSQARAAAASAVLHGSIDGLSAHESLERVGAITGLSLSSSEGLLVVRELPPPEAGAQ